MRHSAVTREARWRIPRQRRVEVRTRPRDDDEVRGVEHVRKLTPGGNVCKRIGTQNEEKLRWPMPAADAAAATYRS